MIRDQGLYIQEILDSIDKIQELVHQHSKEEFEDDWVLQDAVFRRLAIIGEASSKLSSALRDQHPEIPWHEIIAMRNVVVHAYYELDLDRTWATITRDLLQLRQALADAPELELAAY